MENYQSENLVKSKNFTEEYCCSVVRVGALEDVGNSDNLKKTTINGELIVVNKNDVKEGDVMLYISNECQIDDVFLYENNLYSDWEENSNADEIRKWIKKEPEFLLSENFKKMKGYFGKNGRVRMIRLRGCPSFGVLFKPEALVNAYGNWLLHIDWEAMVGTDFDAVICCPDVHSIPKVFVKPYVPPVRGGGYKAQHTKVSKWDRFDRMVEGQFRLHYDTELLKKHLDLFKPETKIDVSVKLHGTSFICANVLVNYPKPLYRLRRFVNRILKTDIPEFNEDYGMVVSSRKVIKNEWANNKHPEGYYGVDIWTEYGEMLYPYIPKGFTIYGEICGYLTGDNRMIQKGYDYGCKVGENFLMIYRITEHTESGLKEYSIEEIITFTHYLIKAMDRAQDKNVGRIFSIGEIMCFSGSVSELTSDVEELPAVLSKRFKIEENEPYCEQKVPREGVVVRIQNDEVAEAFKLKGVRFLERESKNVDNNEVDIEMQNNL